MSFKDTANNYGTISRFNHWLSATIIFGMLAVGLYFNDMPRGDEKFYWLKLHISVGGLVFLYLYFRVFWRIFTKSPDPVVQPKVTLTSSKIVHWVLLLGVLTMAITGPLLVWTRGTDINVFNWFAIPTPIGKMPELHELMETIHKIVSKVLMVAIFIHLLAAIKHQVTNKNVVLSRMVKFLRK